MTDFINPRVLEELGPVQDRPLPITQGFIDITNDLVRRNPDTNPVAAVAEAAIASIAALEIKLYKLMEALDVRETTLSPGNWKIEKTDG